ncbi:MAG TPA: hypothetical protein DHV15_10430 [Treponema sp.]|uniref:Uncharacterized protein n=1 Tax=Treponema denticola (strain ATCC 35405 / DSM 14222 / CIP 103919 / JCM 8153 / KCTC 15104) TaxID=243275 RepID=Q73LF9_TREDE|nr:hypothetical protein TDE_1905 [Treponema denticola ATCC 35405]HCY95901.1 hypothetical protein [Treponema sp.]
MKKIVRLEKDFCNRCSFKTIFAVFAFAAVKSTTAITKMREMCYNITGEDML